jgi:hypothetical protein
LSRGVAYENFFWTPAAGKMGDQRNQKENHEPTNKILAITPVNPSAAAISATIRKHNRPAKHDACPQVVPFTDNTSQGLCNECFSLCISVLLAAVASSAVSLRREQVPTLPVNQHLPDGGVCRVGLQASEIIRAFPYGETGILGGDNSLFLGIVFPGRR